MTGPPVSVVVPCYNAAKFLPDAIASVRAQDYAPIEIIVVDDGSTDDTPQVAAALGAGIRYLRQDNAGPASARNHGLHEARGEFIGFADADDQWPEGKLELQVGRLLAEPSLDVVTGRIRYIELPGAKKLDLPFEGPDNTVAHIHLGAGLFRRRVFEKVGLLDETLRISEDFDWFIRAREAGLRIVVLHEVTLLYRLHESNMTRELSARELMLTRVLHDSLARRRQKGGTAQALPTWSSLDDKRNPDS